jgi:hypothetical protein
MKVKITEVHPSSDRPIEFDCRFPLDIDIVATLDPSWSHALDEIGFQVKIPWSSPHSDHHPLMNMSSRCFLYSEDRLH